MPQWLHQSGGGTFCNTGTLEKKKSFKIFLSENNFKKNKQKTHKLEANRCFYITATEIKAAEQ